MVALATVDDVLARYPDADPALALVLLEAASTRVRRHCRRSFTTGARTAERHLSDGAVYLREQPVVAVSEVRQVAAAPGTATALDDTSWRLVGGSVVDLPTGELEIDYTYGFTTVPTDVVDVVAHMVARRTSTDVAPALQQERIGAYFVGYATGGQSALSGSMQLSDDDRETLRPYRLRKVGVVAL
jgi:hypothetical protein